MGPAALDNGDPPAAQRYYEASRALPVSPDALFAHLDDQTRLGAHMETSSAMMGGGRMTFAFDAERGMAVGSRIHRGGSAFGLTLSVDEVVTVREPPRRKAWRTIGKPRLLIIGGYEMGFEIADVLDGCELTVRIDYWLPRGSVGALLGRLFSGFYARWCVGRMVADAAEAFSSPTGAASTA